MLRAWILFTLFVCGRSDDTNRAALMGSVLRGLLGKPGSEQAQRAQLSAARARDPTDCSLALQYADLLISEHHIVAAVQALVDAPQSCRETHHAAYSRLVERLGTLPTRTMVEEPRLTEEGMGKAATSTSRWSSLILHGVIHELLSSQALHSAIRAEGVNEEEMEHEIARLLAVRYFCTLDPQKCIISSPDITTRLVRRLNSSLGEMAGPFTTSGLATVVMCMQAGSSAINSNMLFVLDPRAAARAALTLAWSSDGVTQPLDLQQGMAAVFPSRSSYFLPVNRDTENRIIVVYEVLPGPAAPPSTAFECNRATSSTLTESWPTRVFQESLTLGSSVLDVTIEAILSAEKKEEGRHRSNKGGWQSRTDWLERHGMASLRETLYRSVVRALNAFGRTHESVEIEIHASWACVNRQHTFNSPHTHPDATLSGVLYLRASHSSSMLVFSDPRSPLTNVSLSSREGSSEGPDEKGEDVIESWAVRPTDGLVVLFPSWLTHHVTPSNSKEPRIAIAFNVRVTACEQCPARRIRIPSSHRFVPAA
eukprot:m.229645 g.229645  ORF g.229645 m.229645 type:complete len:538 (-) comp17794_c0_seq1:2289-3902(-)